MKQNHFKIFSTGKKTTSNKKKNYYTECGSKYPLLILDDLPHQDLRLITPSHVQFPNKLTHSAGLIHSRNVFQYDMPFYMPNAYIQRIKALLPVTTDRLPRNRQTVINIEQMSLCMCALHAFTEKQPDDNYA